MSDPTRPPRVDDDGVRTSTPSTRTARAFGAVLIGAALAVLAASATAVWWLRRDPGHTTAPTVTTSVVEPPVRIAAHAVRPVAARPSTASSAEPPQQAAKPVRRPATSPPAAAAAPAVGTGTAPAAASGASGTAGENAPDAERARVEQHDAREIEKMAQDVINGMRAAGETKGLAAIPPPGTNPVKAGVVVPKDFELPEGYIRHYQTTDDGKRLEPILMFSPDYEFVDDQGKPIELPKDGIVPPEMVPSGMPVRVLDPPGSRAAHARPAGDEH